MGKARRSPVWAAMVAHVVGCEIAATAAMACSAITDATDATAVTDAMGVIDAAGVIGAAGVMADGETAVTVAAMAPKRLCRKMPFHQHRNRSSYPVRPTRLDTRERKETRSDL